MAETTRRGHATRLSLGAAADGVDVVVVLGGDGTLNEAANGLAGSDTALAPLPGGSTNVFARQLGLPDDPIEATGVLLDALAQESGGHRPRDGERSLLPLPRRDRLRRRPRRPGRAPRRAQALRRPRPVRLRGLDTWVRHYDRSRPHFSVHHADGKVIDDGYMTVVLNTNPYTYVGNRPFNLAPDATLDRPLTSVTVRSLRSLPFLRLIGSALGTGARLRSSRMVDYRPDVSRMTVRGFGPFPYQVDGDYLGDVDELEFRHEPDVLRLVMPV